MAIFDKIDKKIQAFSSKRHLKRKITNIILFLVIPLFIVISGSLTILGIRLYKSLDTNQESFKKNVINTFDYYKLQTLIYSNMIAKNYNVQRGAGFNNTGMILKFLVPTRKEFQVDVITVHNKQGVILAQAHNPDSFNINDDKNEAVKKSLGKGIRTFGVIKYKNNILLKSTVPIFHESEENMVIGAVTVGYFLNYKFASKIHKVSGVEILFLKNNQLTSSSFGKPIGKQYPIPFNTETETRNINRVDYDIGYIPIERTKVKNLKIGFAVDNSKLKTTLFWIIVSIAVLFLLAVFISVKFATAIGNNIVNVVHTIRNATEKFANKNFDERISLDSNDEFKELSDTFNSMAESIYKYSTRMEVLVAERTKELQEKNDKIMKDLEIAKKIQETVIKSLPKTPELAIDAQYKAMENLGGDVYDIRKIGKNTYSFLIADVSGHGVPASLITTMTKTSFINRGHFSKTPAQVCAEVNRDLFGLIGDTEYYLTAFYAMLDVSTKEIQFTNCGHHEGIVYRNETGELDKLTSEGLFIGIIEEVDYKTETSTLNLNDKLVLFTDGIPEARNAVGDFFTNERLENLIKETGSENPEHIIDALTKDVNAFCQGHPPNDDRAVLVIELIKTKNKIDTEIFSPAQTNMEDNSNGMDIAAFNKTIKLLNLDKKPLNIQINDAIKKVKTKEFEDAYDILLNLYQYFPDNVNILNALGVTTYKKGELNESLKYFNSLKQIDNSYPNVDDTINLIEKKLNK